MAERKKDELTEEEIRLEESRLRRQYWKRWGPYLSERQWGTVREDYSLEEKPWEYFPFEQARSRAYRWGEDGIGGISDRHQLICFALTLWNGRDNILKERLFGLSGEQGNHGEDLKEYCFYLDSTPTHSYMKFLYKYPQKPFPYELLRNENGLRKKDEPEFELMDTGIFDDNRYFDIFIEYAKASPEDILVRITAHNRGSEPADLHLLPTLWFRNTWSWGYPVTPPKLSILSPLPEAAVFQLDEPYYHRRWLTCQGKPRQIFTENETNFELLYHTPNRTPYVKDGFHEFIIKGNEKAINSDGIGTKAAALYFRRMESGEAFEVRLRLTDYAPAGALLKRDFDGIFEQRIQEADRFFSRRLHLEMSEDGRKIQRQAFAGMLWNKQFYHYDVNTWLKGDPAGPPPPRERRRGRNHDWTHLYNEDIISMPDKWEYPWYAAWDLAFHCLPLAQIDPDFAKEQLVLFLREWYMHPNGQIPAYEWSFDDVNPPLHAWAAWRVYKIEKRIRGRADRTFLERIFLKLLLNFTWWVNRKDPDGHNVFQGGFLGLDNIGLFDRSEPLPDGGFVEQSDGTSWMGMYCLNMMAIALELAKEDRSYQDIASKFFEHFVYIADAINNVGHEGLELWDEEDGFYYDVLHIPGGGHRPLKVRSMVGLIPLFAVETLEPEMVDALPGFKKRMLWFIENRPQFGRNVNVIKRPDGKIRRLLSIVGGDHLPQVLRYMLDENEFLSPFGIRALSRYHKDHPFALAIDGNEHEVNYEPAESNSALFGGNSNWRGPVWFPVNYLIIESLQKYHHFYGDTLKFECPGGSGRYESLWDIAGNLAFRLNRLFLRGEDGNRPAFGKCQKFQTDPLWRDYLLFHEYFHGDNGTGLGAMHQTGWTGLVAKLMEQYGCGTVKNK